MRQARAMRGTERTVIRESGRGWMRTKKRERKKCDCAMKSLRSYALSMHQVSQPFHTQRKEP